MLKKYSITNFVLLVIIAILGVLLSVCPFNVPTSTDRYNGFVGAIQQGVDLGGGVSAIYEAELNGTSYNTNIAEVIDSSLNKIEDGLNHNADYTELFVTRQGDNKVRIEVSNTQDTDYTFRYLEDGKQIFITLDQASETLTNPDIYLESNEIQTAYVGYDYDNSVYTVVLEFTRDGQNSLSSLLDDADETSKTSAYIYINEVNSDNLLSTITIDDAINNNTLTFTSSDSTNYSSSSSTATLELVYSIIGGSLGVDLTLLETSYISPVLGENTLLYAGIASIVIIVLTLVLLCVRYGHMGLLGSLSINFYLILFVFFMQAIPFIVLNLSALFGCLFAFVLAVISNIFIFEKIREEYALGKKIHLSFKSGIKKSLWTILDSHIIIVLATAMLWIFAPSPLKGFAITIMLGALLSAFASLVITRYLLNIYLPLNSTKAKMLHLYRDKNVKEIKEDDKASQTQSEQETLVTETTIGGNNNE